MYADEVLAFGFDHPDSARKDIVDHKIGEDDEVLKRTKSTGSPYWGAFFMPFVSHVLGTV